MELNLRSGRLVGGSVGVSEGLGPAAGRKTLAPHVLLRHGAGLPWATCPHVSLSLPLLCGLASAGVARLLTAGPRRWEDWVGMGPQVWGKGENVLWVPPPTSPSPFASSEVQIRAGSLKMQRTELVRPLSYFPTGFFVERSIGKGQTWLERAVKAEFRLCW